jgi:hypothetical protein
MKHYIVTLSDKFGAVLLVPVEAKNIAEAMSKATDIDSKLFASECREVSA